MGLCPGSHIQRCWGLSHVSTLSECVALAAHHCRPRWDAATLADTVFCSRPLRVLVRCLAVSSIMPRKAAQAGSAGAAHGRRHVGLQCSGAESSERGWAASGTPTSRPCCHLAHKGPACWRLHSHWAWPHAAAGHPGLPAHQSPAWPTGRMGCRTRAPPRRAALRQGTAAAAARCGGVARARRLVHRLASPLGRLAQRRRLQAAPASAHPGCGRCPQWCAGGAQSSAPCSLQTRRRWWPAGAAQQGQGEGMSGCKWLLCQPGEAVLPAPWCCAFAAVARRASRPTARVGKPKARYVRG